MSKREEFKEDLGSLLRIARDEKGLSREDLARCLHLDLSIISKIEENRFEDLAVPAFVHGYVRSISKELNIDPKAIARHLESQLARENPSLSDFETRPPKQTTSDSSFFKYITYFLVISLVSLTVNWWRSADEKNSTKSKVSSSSVSRNANVSASGPYALSPTNTISKSLRETNSQYDFRPIEHTDSQQRNKNGVITIKSISDTWVEIRDGAGLRSFYDLNNPDETIELAGTPPYRITIGNAATAKVRIDGSLVSFDKISEYGVAFVEIGER